MKRYLKLSILLLLLLNSAHLKAEDTLVVGYSEASPFIYENNGEIHGPLYWLWEQIHSEIESSYSLKKINSEELLDQLERGEVDLCIYPLTITSERSKKVNFTTPFYLAYSGVLTKDLSNWDKSILFLKTFFSLNFFRAIGALIIVILLFGIIEWLFERKVNNEEFGNGLKGLWDGFWWSAVTMTTVGYGDKSPKTNGGRIVALIWMFTAIMIISGFTASIASSLTITELETSMNNINDLKKNRLGTVEGSSTHKWLKDNFFKNKALYKNKQSLIEALQNNEVENIAYDLPLLNEMYKNNNLSGYRILDLKYNPQYYAIALRKNISDSTLNSINTHLLKATESYEWDVILSEYNLKH